MSWAALLALAALASQEKPQEASAPTAGQALALILQRVDEPDDAQLAVAAEELARVEEAYEPLLAALGSARAPDEEAAPLGARQLELVLAALERLGSSRLDAFVAQTARAPRSTADSCAALRILGAHGRASDLPTLLSLGRMAEERAAFGAAEAVFGDALFALLARAPEAHARLRERFASLGPETGSAALRASERTGSREALACVHALLGLRRGLDAAVLQALGNLAARAEPDERVALAESVVPYLSSAECAEVLAAAATLGRLGQPDTIPDLIEVLVSGERTLVRAALAALRVISGVSLPASAQAWRSWYGREETWRQERAPRVLATLAKLDGTESVGDLCAWLRELSEHPLHRDALAPQLTPLLGHPRAHVRVLVCECLQRLGSRLALGPLAESLQDESPEVVAAARGALLALGGEAVLAGRELAQPSE